jgi:hypothetical protein
MKTRETIDMLVVDSRYRNRVTLPIAARKTNQTSVHWEQRIRAASVTGNDTQLENHAATGTFADLPRSRANTTSSSTSLHHRHISQSVPSLTIGIASISQQDHCQWHIDHLF